MRPNSLAGTRGRNRPWHRRDSRQVSARQLGELRESREVLLSFLDSSQVMMLVADVDTQMIYVVYCNKPTADYFGTTCAAMAGKSVEELGFNSAQTALYLSHYQQAKRTRKPVVINSEGTRGGGTRHFSSTINYIGPGQTARDRYSLITIDVSEQKVAERKLAEISRLKSDFLARAIHQIRTPLSGVLGMIRLLRSTELNPEQEAHVSTLATCSEALQATVSSLFDAAKIEAGRLMPAQHLFELRQAFDQAISIATLPAQEKGLHIRTFFSSQLPRLVNGDISRLRQIVLNLLMNAIHATAEQDISLTVECHRPGNDVYVVEVAVADRGAGMSAEECGRLFERLPALTIESTAGDINLDLAICKSLCTMMGGRIWVESTVGLGSTYKFTVTLASAAEPKAKQARPLIANPWFAARYPLNILVAEDNEVSSQAICAFLRKMGYRPLTCGTGNAAVTLQTQHSFDVIFMDVHMPDGDGLTATHAIRSILAATRPTIVAVTATAMQDDLSNFARAGMDDYLSKPLAYANLVGVLERHLLRASSWQLRDSNAGAHSGLASVPADPQAMASRRVAVQAFIAEFPRYRQRLLTALTSTDLVALATAAQTLKDAVAPFTYSLVYPACSELEQTARAGSTNGAARLIAIITKDGEALLNLLGDSEEYRRLAAN